MLIRTKVTERPLSLVISVIVLTIAVATIVALAITRI